MVKNGKKLQKSPYFGPKNRKKWWFSAGFTVFLMVKNGVCPALPRFCVKKPLRGESIFDKINDADRCSVGGVSRPVIPSVRGDIKILQPSVWLEGGDILK